jgi:hypothetical protein
VCDTYAQNCVNFVVGMDAFDQQRVLWAKQAVCNYVRDLQTNASFVYCGGAHCVAHQETLTNHRSQHALAQQRDCMHVVANANDRLDGIRDL